MTTLAIRDVSLFVKIMGRGSPLLLMHGGPGLDHTTLLSLAPLADRYTLIFYDHRCNGRSTGAVESMTWENLTADAEGLRQTLGYTQWAVLGHSFGGHVALEYALRHPASLTQLVLMDTAGDAFWPQVRAPEILKWRGYSRGAVRAAQRFFNGQLLPNEMLFLVMRFLRAYFYHFGVKGVMEGALAATRLKMRPEAHVFGFGTLLPGWSVMERLHEIEVPTLVLAGREDFLFPPEHQAILADRLPNAQLEIVERAGHNPQDERARAVIDLVNRFLLTTRPSELARPTAPI